MPLRHLLDNEDLSRQARDTCKEKKTGREKEGGVFSAGSLPDNETLTTAQGFLRDAQQTAAANAQAKFWLGVGFVKPHMSQAFPEGFLAQVPAESEIVLATNQTNPIDTSPMEWSDGASGF
jgi:hypothetical protein